MPLLLALLGQFVQKSLDYAKFVGGLLKVEMFRMAIRAKCLVLFFARFTAVRVAYWAAIVVIFDTAVTALAVYVASPISSSVLQTILPESGWAQALYYLVWDSGVSLKFAWSALLIYWGNVFLVRRALLTLASALTYRIMVWDGEKQVNFALLYGSK